METKQVKVAITGTGFIASGLVAAINAAPDLMVHKVLTRRKLENISMIPAEYLTHSISEFLQGADLVVECSGDVHHGTEVILEAFSKALPVVTMNAELQVTTGSYLSQCGYLTEAEGDQPGSLAALAENAVAMGFSPLVYGNIKGFLNLNPSIEEMRYWSKRNGLSLQMVTSFTDGTKVQIEQALVANGLGADIVTRGLKGIAADSLEIGANQLAEAATEYGQPISDYLLCPSGPPGVFLTGTHQSEQAAALEYFKMGQGPYYTLTQPFHLCHLEILKTIRRVHRGESVLLNNGATPRVGVAAVSKRNLNPEEVIPKGIGSFQVRGEVVCLDQEPDHIPIGLLRNAVLKRQVEEGKILTMDDVELEESAATRAWFASVGGNPNEATV
ncbi:NAD(P)-dependent oxidoreductase [Alkalicoccobacillus murimartini]|uniref:Homoserine dehydrogenase-like protein n=1 Tax=Alkalicoccobacillus murimartini TaxID=171685 RepID=A0ABT9YGC1_9BACI|nr:NAD(P)-dependent oxidoreductase [Alkalicoccobacillus murimartini]MDQ0206914.1 putative homoserine dehydrogenase-like protein [Alkalicoccobacillus murimartini]